MSKIAAILFLVAFIVCLLVCYVFGLTAAVFPFMILCVFGFSFGVFLVGASVQAEATPGLEELEEPSFCFSRIYDVWLYVNDRAGWALYTAFFSYIIGGMLGSMLGWAILSQLKANPIVYAPSWLAGMFLTLSFAVFIVTTDHWSGNEENRQSVDEVRSMPK